MKAAIISQMVTNWLMTFRDGIIVPVWDFFYILKGELREKSRQLDSKLSSDTTFRASGISSKRAITSSW